MTEVKAEITGYALRDADHPSEALAHLQRVIQLDSSIGVRKDIEQLVRQSMRVSIALTATDGPLPNHYPRLS